MTSQPGAMPAAAQALAQEPGASVSDRLADVERLFNGAFYEQALPLALALHAEVSAVGDSAIAARCAICIAKMYANQDHAPIALRWAELGRQAALASGDLESQAAGGVLIASEHARRDEAAAAMHAMAQVLQLVEGVRDAATLGTAFTGLSFAYRALGMPVHGLQAARQALAAAEPGSDSLRVRPVVNLVAAGLEAHQLMDAADAAALVDELGVHLAWMQAETADYARLGLRGRASYRLLAAGWHALRCEWAQVRALLLPLAGQPFVGPHEMKRDVWLELARAQRALGETAAAQAAAAEAAREQALTGRAPRAVELQRLALLAELQGDTGQALALMREHHLRVLRSVLAAQDERIDALTHRLVAQTLRAENLALRRRNEGLAADVQQIERLASTDPLTGLRNRRALLAHWTQLQAQTQPLSLALLDIDHFKAINDRHSHVVGDAVLCELARVMAAGLRALDSLGRWGGEEFAVLLPGADGAVAAAALERLRGSVQAHDWSVIAPGLAVTVSVGHTLARPGESFDDAAVRADALLYRAKGQGRNQVVGEPSAPPAAGEGA
jgi:diguanylate cyclase (GGDEF)-like protein